jgi:hypothetical protein
LIRISDVISSLLLASVIRISDVRRAWIGIIKAESRRLLCEYMQFDTEFQEEFNRIMDDLSDPEADKDFTRDFFDDTDLNTELAIPRDGDGPEFARAATRSQSSAGRFFVS